MNAQWRPGEARHLLHRRTPWLYFHRDHPLAHERWKQAKQKKEESLREQMGRLHEILVLPDDGYWPATDDDRVTPIRTGSEM